jgi:hypothetical protein
MDAASSNRSLFDYLVITLGEQIDIVPSTTAMLVHLSHAIEDTILRRLLAQVVEPPQAAGG